MTKVKSKNPWGVGTPWKTEKDFYNWLRSQTRRIWSRHPIKITYKNNRRYKAPVGLKGRDVWVSDCEICGEASRACEVDHILPGGSFTDWKSYTEWSRRILYVSYDDIRELCPECHGAVTLSQKLGITFEEAKVQKQIIKIVKEKKDKEFFISRKLNVPSNSAKRRHEMTLILEKEYKDIMNDST